MFIESPERLMPIEIKFGDVFIARQGTYYVIINTGCREGVSASQIYSIDGKECLGLPGTTTRGDIIEIVGHWNDERIIEAMMNHLGDVQPVGRVYNLLRQYSKQKSRILS